MGVVNSKMSFHAKWFKIVLWSISLNLEPLSGFIVRDCQTKFHSKLKSSNEEISSPFLSNFHWINLISNPLIFLATMGIQVTVAVEIMVATGPQDYHFFELKTPNKSTRNYTVLE